MTPLWKPMPYYVMRDCTALKNIRNNNVSTGIAALKIFTLICLKSESDEQGGYSASITYDQFAQYCSLSRKLISEGLKYLVSNGVIETSGERKKRYILMNCRRENKQIVKVRFSSSHGYWCKLPYKGLVDENNRITAFESMGNRSLIELNSLKIYLYLLMVRSSGKAYSAITLKTLKERLSISYQQIMVAIGFLNTIGLITRAEVGSNSVGNYDERFPIKFLVGGWESLEWKPHYFSNENDNKEWREHILDDLF